MTPPCEDWRRLDAGDMAPLLDEEARRWRAELGWDVVKAWRSIEPARRAGHLPGLVVRDEAGAVTGWTCYLLHRQTLQVAMIVGTTPEAAEALIDGILQSPEAQRAATHSVCVRDAAPGTREILAARGFDVARYRYVELPLGMPGPYELPCRPWEVDDAGAMARLCSRAYDGASEVRAFAPHGSLDEWHEYIATLVTGPGCGEFLPAASFTIAGRSPRRLDGGIITTHLGPGTAHIAQVAVDPDARGQGWGRALVVSAIGAAASAGLRRITLLVADGNARAEALYADLGFVNRAEFVVAIKRQPRRLKSVALATGGASTRR